jgi:hypothetical protein
VGGIDLSQRKFVPTTTGSGLKISYGSGATDFAYWNGLNNQGLAVASGTYVVQVTQNTGSGKKTFAESVTVIELSATVFDGAIAYPNPAGPGVSSVLIQLTGLAGEAWGDVYNLAGERIGALSSDPLGLRWDLSSESASGIYIARVNARDNQGHMRSQSIKIALTR